MCKKPVVIILGVGVILYFSQNSLFAKKSALLNSPPDVAQIEPITKEDRILILAPHPDDEALGAGGIIQKARDVGAEVKAAYLTNGEHNQLAFIVYEKRLVIKQKAIIGMGEVRRKEAITAMKALGVPEENLIFLGYPDFGTLSIFLRYWGETKPFKNMMTRVSGVPYRDALTPNALYKGESILWDIESVLRKYRPTKIFVTSPVDTNGDHRAYYLFLQVALWDLKGKIPEPKVYPYLIHCYGWPKPRHYHPNLYQDVPALLKKSQIEWRTSKLSDEEVKKKYNAICMYKSQCSDSAFYLKSFARRNELFGDYPEIDLAKEGRPFEMATNFHDKAVAYGKVTSPGGGDKLLVNVFLKKESGHLRRFYVNLAGYNPAVEFSQMPKLKINVSEDNIKVLDRGKFIKVEGLEAEYTRRSVTLKVPLKILSGPERILASVNTYTENFPSDLNAWRVIKVR